MLGGKKWVRNDGWRSILVRVMRKYKFPKMTMSERGKIKGVGEYGEKVYKLQTYPYRYQGSNCS